ncbi:hypothetical protein DPMN_047071 [Dreissena polymorpha]|uniref:Uncharacterized protein n=1 Tax=Dreissena polymorpha TaxID=45954 RepID=A0A9D4HYS7_DREPO|nr:hypothetical protein DPMN_047071 [Dreissena polymorpha]
MLSFELLKADSMIEATFAGISWLFVSCVKLLVTSGLLLRRTEVFPWSMSSTAFARTLIALSRSASSSSSSTTPPRLYVRFDPHDNSPTLFDCHSDRHHFGCL